MEKKNSLEELKYIYADVSEWLKFLEAKHAGVFAVWTAILIALFSTEQFYKIPIWIQIILVGLACGGLLINIIALIPFLNQKKRLKKIIQRRTYKKYSKYGENAVFYTAIYVKTYNTENDFREEALKRYKAILENRNFEGLDETLIQDYMNQIIDVSVVGSIKAYLFDIAARYFIVVMIVGIAIMIVA